MAAKITLKNSLKKMQLPRILVTYHHWFPLILWETIFIEELEPLCYLREDPVKVFIEIKFFIKDFFRKYDQLKKNLNGKAINWNKKILPVKIKENMECKWEGRCLTQNLPVQSQKYKQKDHLELSR